jgi:hypothetical protein
MKAGNTLHDDRVMWGTDNDINLIYLLVINNPGNVFESEILLYSNLTIRAM